LQPELNIGLFGHVDHGKTTLVKALTGKWTDTHSEELKRGITIKLGYADLNIYYCDSCKKYSPSEKHPECGGKCRFIRKLSFVDAPGHESLMATAISASSVIDGALFLVSANEKCPQEQTREHFMILEKMGVKNIIIVQTKTDIVSREKAMENYREIKEFIKGTFAENAPIIPISAPHALNLDALLEQIDRVMVRDAKDESSAPLAYVVRSFDINRPGEKIEKLKGGVLGCAIVRGRFKAGDEIEIKPGFGDGEGGFSPLKTSISSLRAGEEDMPDAGPGGLVGIGTFLDPSLTKSDTLIGNIVSKSGAVPNPSSAISMRYELIDRKDIENAPLRLGEPLLINIHSSTSVGAIAKLNKGIATVSLKRPVIVFEGDRIAISRRIGQRWRFCGIGSATQK
jgi:translation initiation factor 2 subunit 3